jgi:putative endonuclease
VKLRKDSRFAEAREFVHAAKQGRILKTAQQYLAEHETNLQPRFDVIEIYAPEGAREKDYIVNHIENAF